MESIFMGVLMISSQQGGFIVSIGKSVSILLVMILLLSPLIGATQTRTNDENNNRSDSDDQIQDETENKLELEWIKTYRPYNLGELNSILQTSDGGFIITGEANHYTETWDLLLAKIDKDGESEWDYIFGGIENECGNSVIESSDGGYVITGYTESYGSTYGERDFWGELPPNVWLVKTDSDGEMLWRKAYGGNGNEVGHDLIETVDGGFLLLAWSDSTENGSGTWLIKTDSNGNMEWNRTIGYGGERCYSIEPTNDGGYIISGVRTVKRTSYVLLIKIDKNYDMEWFKNYNYDSWNVGIKTVQTSDGGYILTGLADEESTDEEYGDSDVIVVKCDSTGNEQWFKRFGDDRDNEVGYSVIEVSFGGYLIACRDTLGYGGQHFFWMIRLDYEGNLIWEKNYEEDYTLSNTYEILETVDNEIIVGCSGGGYNFQLLKYTIKSDLPTCAISTPEDFSTITSLFRITGTASDGKRYLEDVAVQIDDGEWYTATGTDDWYFDLETSEMDEGEHTINARAFDGIYYSEMFNITVIVDSDGDGIIEENPPDEDKKSESLIDTNWVFISALSLIVIVMLVLVVILVRQRALENKKGSGDSFPPSFDHVHQRKKEPPGVTFSRAGEFETRTRGNDPIRIKKRPPGDTVDGDWRMLDEYER
jgi:hypothetical protein